MGVGIRHSFNLKQPEWISAPDSRGRGCSILVMALVLTLPIRVCSRVVRLHSLPTASLLAGR
jgi:hypothetical protein